MYLSETRSPPGPPFTEKLKVGLDQHTECLQYEDVQVNRVLVVFHQVLGDPLGSQVGSVLVLAHHAGKGCHARLRRHRLIEALLEDPDCQPVESPFVVAFELQLEQDVNELPGALNREADRRGSIVDWLIRKFCEPDLGVISEFKSAQQGYDRWQGVNLVLLFVV